MLSNLLPQFSQVISSFRNLRVEGSFPFKAMKSACLRQAKMLISRWSSATYTSTGLLLENFAGVDPAKTKTVDYRLLAVLSVQIVPDEVDPVGFSVGIVGGSALVARACSEVKGS